MDLKNVKYLESFQDWGIPKENSLIIGSAVMALYGIRSNVDLDVLVAIPTFLSLRFERGLDLVHGKHSGLFKYQNHLRTFEIYGQGQHPCIFGSCVLTKAILQKSINVDGYNFLTLKDLLAFKQRRMRPYDIEDIKLINGFVND